MRIPNLPTIFGLSNGSHRIYIPRDNPSNMWAACQRIRRRAQIQLQIAKMMDRRENRNELDGKP